MLPVINADTFPFFDFLVSFVNLRIQEYVFTLCNLTAKKTLAHFSISGYKYGDTFSARSRIEVFPSSYFRCCQFLKLDEFSVNVTKITFNDIVSNTQITLNYSLKYSFIDIRNNRSLFLLFLQRIFT